jgi:hypothetical protein
VLHCEFVRVGLADIWIVAKRIAKFYVQKKRFYSFYWLVWKNFHRLLLHLRKHYSDIVPALKCKVVS